MAITLAEAQVNTQDDVAFAIIDELRRNSWLMDQVTWDDCVNPAGGGATLSYGYTRLTQTRGAAFRPLNDEYRPDKARRTRHTAYLSPLGGTYEVDRVLAHLGERATDEQAFQVAELLTAVRMKFAEEMIRGDQTANGPREKDGAAESERAGFDGLDKALTGSVTEMVPDGGVDWTASGLSTEQAAHAAIEPVEEMLSLLNGQPDAILCNRQGALRLTSLARRAGYYTRSEDALGRQVQTFAGVPFVDLGDTNAWDDTAEGLGHAATEPIIPTVGGRTSLYAVRFGLNGYHGVATVGELVRQWAPDWTTAGAVKTGEVEMGPVAMVLKHARACGVLRDVQVAPAGAVA